MICALFRFAGAIRLVASCRLARNC
jgi:hypothetical protein